MVLAGADARTSIVCFMFCSYLGHTQSDRPGRDRCPITATSPSGQTTDLGGDRWYQLGKQCLPFCTIHSLTERIICQDRLMEKHSQHSENTVFSAGLPNVDDVGDALPLRSPGPFHCGTVAVGWLSGWNTAQGTPPANYSLPGRYPLRSEGVVNMTVCFDHPKDPTDVLSGSNNTCQEHAVVQVVQCSDSLLWKLPYAPSCGSGYCTALQRLADVTCDIAPSPPHSTGCGGSLHYPSSCR